MKSKHYPKSPTNLPKGLTSLPPSYQFRATLAVLAIILFFILYVTLVIALGYLVRYAFVYDMGSVNKITILLKVGSVLGAVMLFAFTLKFIFKLKNHKPENRKKLDKNKQKELWDFVDEICKETGAPKPKNIYVDPDVNAYVSYSNMWLSLFLPVKKELTIGLGIVNCLNMSEFKAVISHEFGHFAQRSMKIGSYIISANTIIHDMIFSRDKWDELLDTWRASDIRLSFAAWMITPVIWVIRQVLNLFYQFLNVMYSSLSREMEFNADKVAISTSGSDAIISALWKLDEGFVKWNSATNHLYLASQKNMYVKNVYTHNALDIKRDLQNQQDILKKLPEDKRGGKQYFSNHNNSKVSMYASHPPNDSRQDNAKTPYIACEIDESSPWKIFIDNNALQEELTELIYKQYFGKKPTYYVEAEGFENFIKAETQDKALLEEYDNTFENRFFNIPQINEIIESKVVYNTFKEEINKLKKELKNLTKPIKEIEVKMQLAQQIADGTTKAKFFNYNGVDYKKNNVQKGYENLIIDREKLFKESFIEWDKSFIALNYNEAKKKNKENHLLNLYKQHITLTDFYKEIVATKNGILEKLDTIQNTEVTEEDVTRFGGTVKNVYYHLNHHLKKFDEITFIPLPNIENVKELKEAIIENGEYEKYTGEIFESGKFNQILNLIENSTLSCQRIEQKSIGSILAFQNSLHN